MNETKHLINFILNWLEAQTIVLKLVNSKGTIIQLSESLEEIMHPPVEKKVEVLFAYDMNILLSFTADGDEFWNTVRQEMNYEAVPLSIPDEEDDTHQFYTRNHHLIEFFWEVCILLEHTDIEFELLQYYPNRPIVKTFVEEALSEDEIHFSDNIDIYEPDRLSYCSYC